MTGAQAHGGAMNLVSVGTGLIYRRAPASGRLFQGEILAQVAELRPSYEKPAAGQSDRIVGSELLVHTLAIVASQDCDLEQDWAKREGELHKETDLPCITLYQLGMAEAVLAKLAGGDIRKQVQNNKNERYQYLAPVPPAADADGEGLDATCIDFKRCFAIPTVELYRQIRAGVPVPTKRRACLNTPWVEHLQNRIAAYMSRIPLSELHFTPEARRPQT